MLHHRQNDEQEFKEVERVLMMDRLIKKKKKVAIESSTWFDGKCVFERFNKCGSAIPFVALKSSTSIQRCFNGFFVREFSTICLLYLFI